jgi:hypothetical protein
LTEKKNALAPAEESIDKSSSLTDETLKKARRKNAMYKPGLGQKNTLRHQKN